MTLLELMEFIGYSVMIFSAGFAVGQFFADHNNKNDRR